MNLEKKSLIQRLIFIVFTHFVKFKNVYPICIIIVLGYFSENFSVLIFKFHWLQDLQSLF